MGQLFISFVVIIGIALVIIIICSPLTDNIQIINGKKYRWECVGCDMVRVCQDLSLSKQDKIARQKRGYYSKYAWVELGKPTSSWSEDPVNRETWLKYANDTENTPKYLRAETGCWTRGQYRQKYHI